MRKILNGISMSRLVRGLSLAAAAVFVLSAVPQQSAQAMSLATPGAAPAAKFVSDDMIQVRGGGHGGGGHGGGGHHGGGHGGGWHGGGHGGGWHGGGWHRGGGWHGGGWRGGWHRGWRGGWHGGWHRGWRGYGYGGFYGYPRPCRVIWTYYGPRRVCGWHRWYHRHYW